MARERFVDAQQSENAKTKSHICQWYKYKSVHTIEVEPSGDAVIYRCVVTLPHVAMLENIGTLGYFSPHAFSV